MGNGQDGFATAAQVLLRRPLVSLTAADADTAALLAGIPEAPRDYAPTAGAANVLRRRNQTLTLMAANGSLTPQRLAEVIRRPLPVIAVHPGVVIHAPSAVGHVIGELKAQGIANGLEDLLNGRLDVYSTVDVRVQQIVNVALNVAWSRTRHGVRERVGLCKGLSWSSATAMDACSPRRADVGGTTTGLYPTSTSTASPTLFASRGRR